MKRSLLVMALSVIAMQAHADESDAFHAQVLTSSFTKSMDSLALIAPALIFERDVSTVDEPVQIQVGATPVTPATEQAAPSKIYMFQVSYQRTGQPEQEFTLISDGQEAATATIDGTATLNPDGLKKFQRDLSCFPDTDDKIAVEAMASYFANLSKGSNDTFKILPLSSTDRNIKVALLASLETTGDEPENLSEGHCNLIGNFKNTRQYLNTIVLTDGKEDTSTFGDTALKIKAILIQ